MWNVKLLSPDTLHRKTIHEFFSFFGDFMLAGEYATPEEWLAGMDNTPVNVLFVDERFAGTGDFLKTVAVRAERPAVVVMSATGEMAARSYEWPGVADYLVMPCGRERLLLALEKLRREFSRREMEICSATRRDFIFVKVNKRYVRLPLSDILYVESVRDYIKIVTDKKSYLVYNTLGNFARSLPAEKFLRVHRSYIVAIDRIEWVEGNVIEIAGIQVPATRKYLSDSDLGVFK